MASWSFNPFTGNLDISGSSSVVFEGEVATFTDLPVTIGDPAVGAAFLVRESTGVWLVNRRQAGIYIRRYNDGLTTDWEYAGDYPVTSVNSQSGNVVLGPSDVGAAAATHAASHAAGTRASYTGIGEETGSLATSITIRANNIGTAGNSITLSFNGSNTVAQALATWNAANPSNQATLYVGDGTQVPDSGETITLSGGTAAGSDAFSGINQNLGKTDEPSFDGLTVSGNAVAGQTPDTVLRGGAWFGARDGSIGVGIAREEINSYGATEPFLGFGAYNESVTQYNALGFTTGASTLFLDTGGHIGVNTGDPQETLDVAGNIALRDLANAFTATLDVQGVLSGDVTLTIPNASGNLGLEQPADNIFRIVGSSDATKKVAFEVDGLTAGTTRTLTVPNASGRIQVEGQPIGNTTPAAGSFTTLSATNTFTATNAGASPPTNVTDAKGVQWTSVGGATNQVAIYAGYAGSPTFGIGAGTSAGALSEIAAFNLNGITFNRALTANNGIPLTASAPVLNLAQTWNAGGTTFTALKVNVTDSSSSASSLLLDLQVGGVTRTSVSKGGTIGCSTIGAVNSGWLTFSTSFGSAALMGGVWYFNNGVAFGVNGSLGVNSGVIQLGAAQSFGWSSAEQPFSANADLRLFRDATDTLAQRRGLNPQTFRIYGQITGTDTSATGNYERGFMRWSAAGGVFQIGTEAGSGGGSARNVALTPNNTTVATFATGDVTFSSGYKLFFSSRSGINSPADGNIRLTNWAENGFGLLQLGGTTSGFPALKRNSTTLEVRLANDSDFAPLACGALTINGNVTFQSGNNIVLSATTGTQIGTATTQLLGFYGATPVDRPNDVVMSWASDGSMGDVNDAQDIEARTALFEIRARLRELGLMAAT